MGPESARKKTEGWAAASKALRTRRPELLDLAYAQELRTALDWFAAQAGAHGIAGPVILSGSHMAGQTSGV